MGEAQRKKKAGLYEHKHNRDAIKQFQQSGKPAMLMINEEDMKVPQYKDIDEDYECFVDYMQLLGFNWEDIAKHGLTCEVMLCLHMDPTKFRYQPCFTLPPTTTCENGEPVMEFAVWAGMWTGISEVLKDISNRTGAQMRLITALKHGNDFRIAIMKE